MLSNINISKGFWWGAPPPAHTCCLFSGHSIIISSLSSQPRGPAPMAGRWPGTKSGMFCVWCEGPRANFSPPAPSQRPQLLHCVRSPQLLRSTLQYNPYLVLLTRSVTEHSVGRILWHRQQPTAWRSLTARSSNKTPRPPRRGMFSSEIRVFKIPIITCYFQLLHRAGHPGRSDGGCWLQLHLGAPQRRKCGWGQHWWVSYIILLSTRYFTVKRHIPYIYNSTWF